MLRRRKPQDERGAERRNLNHGEATPFHHVCISLIFSLTKGGGSHFFCLDESYQVCNSQFQRVRIGFDLILYSI